MGTMFGHIQSIDKTNDFLHGYTIWMMHIFSPGPIFWDGERGDVGLYVSLD